MADVATVVAGSTFISTLVDPGGVSYLGARVEVPITRAIVSFWTEATLVGDTWMVELEAPLEQGGYNLVWRTGDPEPPAYEAFIPLSVLAVGSTIPTGTIEEPPVVDRELVTPTVDDVAALERTRTMAEGAHEEITFTDETRPSAAAVEDLIQQALDLTLAELPQKFPVRHYDALRRAVSLYAAVLVEGSFYREQAGDDSSTLWRTLYNTAMLNLQREIAKDLAQWRLLRTLEPHTRVLA